MADVRKLKDEAAQAFAKGKFAKAVELYEDLVKADPKDAQAHMKLGDALVKAGDKARAVATYQRVAESYAGQGFLPKAIAVCKVILEVDPAHSATQKVLAGLYAKKMGDPARRPTSTTLVVTHPTAPKPESASELELGRSDRRSTGFGTAPEPQVAAPPPPPEPSRVVAPPPAMGAAPPPPINGATIVAELAVPLELEVALSPAALARAGLASPHAEPELEIEEGEPEIEPSRPVAAPPPRAPAPQVQWANEDADSIEAQLAHAAAQTPLAPAPEAQGEDDTSIEVAFDVPMAEAAEEEIELLSVTAEVQRNLGRELPKIPLFSDLAPEAFVELMEQCGFVRASVGQAIIREGEAGSSFFVVCSGKMRVIKRAGDEEVTMAFLAEGAFFGELALLSGARRAATVLAEEESELLEISAAVLNNLARRYPHVAASLRQFGRQRLLANVMATSALFRPFDKADRKRLVELFKVREVQAGEQVLREGQPADGLYLVMSGEMSVSRSSASGEQLLASLSDGDLFGEMSLLSKKPASATVTAQRRSTVLRLPRERFEELIVTYPQVLVLVSELADSRTRSNARLGQTLAPDTAHPLV